MQKKYAVEYNLNFRRQSAPESQFFHTDDPVTFEAFVQDLLAQGMLIHSLRYDGIDLPRAEFDRIVKVAASAIASRCICTSLNIKPEEEHYRFGFSA